MATPTRHALLSASSAYRWLTCTAAPRFEELFADKDTAYTLAGTLAHSICELYARREFHPESMSSQKFTARLKKCKNDPSYSDDMRRYAEDYVQFIKEKSMEFDSMPYIGFELKVRFDDYAPEGFGTCDCVLIGSGQIQIIDFKNGTGNIISAVENPQMRLYALGALKEFSLIYGDSIKSVTLNIFQPRVSYEPNNETLTVDELKKWAETVVKPAAEAAHSGNGAVFVPGEEQCRFCKGKAQCKARADFYSAFNDFKDIAIAGKVKAGQTEPTKNMLSDEAVGDLLVKAKGLVQWYKDLQEYATQAILSGATINGWKVVEGRSNRVITDVDALVERFKANGFDEALLFERKPLTLTGYEKLAGKADFAEVSAGLVDKPQGKPTLAPESDKRPPFNSAAADFADFAEVVKNA